jgi:hypothetical protein
MSEAIEALAEAWASLDGKLDEFLAGRGGEEARTQRAIITVTSATLPNWPSD